VRFRDDNPADLARARTAITAWRDQNPAGTGAGLVAAVGRQCTARSLENGIAASSAPKSHPAGGVLPGA
jgi:hypothetical protein